MMTTETNSSARQDEAAVAAVQRGDPERFRELVERHERRVFAVAWSRLGDATLAEEVTQEAFIRAYQRLWLLGDGAKFSGWVNTIARRLAINLGLRHRRELDRRERWALERPEPSPAPYSTEAADPLYTPETLRQALAELPPAHRECLVLFYLEGKSGAAAAVALGISESALRVRLHRARAAMRERLEVKLACSLSQLRPAKTLVPAIMAGVLAASSAKAAAASLGGTTVGALVKFTPLKFLFSFGFGVTVLPGLVLQWIVVGLELRNFRDKEGFRARLFRNNSRWWLLWLALIMVLSWGIMPRLAAPVLHRGGSLAGFYLVLAGLLFGITALMASRLRIIYNRYFMGMVASNFIFATACLAAGLGWMPAMWVGYGIAGQTLLMAFVLGQRPLFTDYNLFLRVVEGVLPPAESVVVRRQGGSYGQSELFQFARFLGSRWLVNNYSSAGNQLVLRLTPVSSSRSSLTWNASYFAFWARGSQLFLQTDGIVRASIHPGDRKALSKLHGGGLPPNEVLEHRVATAVASAWGKFQTGDFAAAERALGQTPESEVFIQPQAKSLSTRLQRALIIGVAIFLVVELFKINELLHFTGGFALSAQGLSQQNYRRPMHDLAAAKTPEQRFCALDAAAKESFAAGKTNDAQSYAQELMGLLPQYQDNWNYGDAVQDANLVLGRIALRNGDLAAAKQYLLAAGKSPGSAVMDSFGPNMTLASDLLEKGERDTVLEYFSLCRRFWKLPQGKLDEWTDEVNAGKTPDFGGNLVY